MKKVIYPGTFDPPTRGHLNVIQRVAAQCGTLIIAVGQNPAKRTVFSVEERVGFFKQITRGLLNVEIVSFSGLLVDCAREQGAGVVIRAMRTVGDFEFEALQAQMNWQLGGVETFYVRVDERYRLISSTLVKEVGRYGRRLTDFVPEEIEEAVFKRLREC